ncbi:MAG: DMT family transporter [Planctomycetota bacterium]|nr:DMT family transporter [Planctomycetota bacterium]
MSFPVGEVASVGAAVCWAIGLTLFRTDVREVGARHVNLFKGLLGTLIFLGIVLVRGVPAVAVEPALYLAASGVVGLAIGDTFLFGALGVLGAHKTALFGSLGPILTALGGWIFLQEALSATQIAGILMAAWGVALVVYYRDASRDPSPTSRGVLYGLVAATCQAAGTLLARVGLKETDALWGTTLRLGAATAALLLWAVMRRDLAPALRILLEPARLRRLVPAVLVATLCGLWLMQVGIKHAPAAVASALHSTTPLFTLPIALFWLREHLGRLGILGSFVAVGGVVVLILAGA